MAEVWVQLPNGERVQMKYSAWTGRLRVYHEGKEMAFLGTTGGVAVFDVGNCRVEIESRLTTWATCEVTVRADGNIIFKRRFL